MAIPILLGKHCSVRDSESCASLAPHRSMNSLKTGRLTISLNPDDASNVRETYSVNVVRGDRRSGTRASVTNATGGAATFDKPIDNIGRKSIPDYQACAAKHVYAVNIPGCNTPARLFAGQRKDHSSSTWAKPLTSSISRPLPSSSWRTLNASPAPCPRPLRATQQRRAQQAHCARRRFRVPRAGCAPLGHQPGARCKVGQPHIVIVA